MEELYLRTQNGNVPIDPEIIEKYHLKKGTMSPFTGCPIVDKNGEFAVEKPVAKNTLEQGLYESSDDSIVELENGIMLSTSEMIDIAEGTDSTTDV